METPNNYARGAWLARVTYIDTHSMHINASSQHVDRLPPCRMYLRVEVYNCLRVEGWHASLAGLDLSRKIKKKLETHFDVSNSLL